jgi:hypothetical protein
MLHGAQTQEVLSLYISIFSDIYDIIGSDFSFESYEKLFKILAKLALYHTNPSNDASLKYKTLLPSDLDQPTTLQQSFLDIISKLSVPLASIKDGSLLLVSALSNFVSLPFIKTTEAKRKANNPDEKSFTYDSFSKKSILILEDSMITHCTSEVFYSSGAFQIGLSALTLPIRSKYDAPILGSKESPPIWKFAINSFLNIVKQAMNSLKQRHEGILKFASKFQLPTWT